MNEQQAHKYLEKKAMNARLTRLQLAKAVHIRGPTGTGKDITGNRHGYDSKSVSVPCHLSGRIENKLAT